MTTFTPELIEKAKAAQTAEQLLEIAKANSVEMSADKASTYFAQLNPKRGELNDDLVNVAGGSCQESSHVKVRLIGQTCSNCGGIDAELVPVYNLPSHIVCVNCGKILGNDVGTIKYVVVG